MTKKRKHRQRKTLQIFKNDQGMTLVEILLAFTVLGIMAVFMGGVFINSLGLISRSGDLDRTGYVAAKVTENAIDEQDLTTSASGDDIIINEGEVNEESVENTLIPVDTEKSITVSFPDKDIDVSGDQKKVTSTGYRNDVTIEVFIPHDDEE